MSGYWFAPDDYAMDPPIVFGAGHSVSSDGPAEDPADSVRRVAEEVTGKEFPIAPRRIGFI